PPPAPEVFRVPPEPPRPDDGELLTAPAQWEHVVLKISFPIRAQYQNLRYEGHNGLLHKGAADATEIAERWRRLARGVRGVFVLRDSLFSQQDYVYGFPPYALMMPPSWVSTAVVETAPGRALVGP